MSPHDAPPANGQPPLIEVVVPVFNEAAVLPLLCARLKAVFDGNPGFRWRAILVDDGSRDTTAQQAEAAAHADRRFAFAQLSRNFGHQAALTAGLSLAGAGDAVVTMDADLQDPPELIPELVAKWRSGAEVVLAVRRSRQEGGIRRVGFDLFHRFFNNLSDFPIETNTGTFGLLSRHAVEAFNRLPERHRFFPGLRSWVGFPVDEILYDRPDRVAGKPAQTLHRLVRYGLDAVFSFSHLPLRLLTYTGLFFAAGGFALGVFFVVRRLLGIEIAQTGFTTLVTLLLFLGGIQLIGIGILGEYLGRVYDEVKQRPNFVLRRTVGLE